MTSEFISSQKKMLSKILRTNAKTSLFVRLEISNLYKEKDFDKQYSAFSSMVPIFSKRSFMDYVNQMKGGGEQSEIELLSEKGVVSKSGSAYIATENCSDRLTPVQKSHLNAMERIEKDAIKLIEKQSRPIKGKIFHFFEDTDSMYHLSGAIVAGFEHLWALNRSGRWGRRFLPTTKAVSVAGRSRYQRLHAFLDELERHGKDIEAIIACPRTLTEISMILAQREGRFVPLQDICPQLKLYLHTGESILPHRKELEYFFKGLLGLKVVEFQTFAEGMVAIQKDVNISSWLKPYDETGIFCEFIENSQILSDGRLSRDATRLHSGQVERGREYLLLISNMSGLICLNTEQIVKVESLKPFRISFRRPVRRLDHFNEMLAEDTVNKLIMEVNNALVSHGVFIRDYMIADDTESKQPLWVLEVSRPVDGLNVKLLQSVANQIHQELSLRDSYYNRAFSQSMVGSPQFVFVPMGTFSSMSDKFRRIHFDFTPDAKNAKAVVSHAWAKRVIQANDAI